MKQFILLVLGMTLCIGLMAQEKSAIDTYFSEYSQNENFTSIKISPGLFKLMANMADDEDIKEMRKAISNFQGIKILAYEGEGGTKALDYFQSADRTLVSNRFEELMTIESGTDNVKFLVDQVDDEIIRELLLIAGDEEDFVLIDIKGDINLKAFADATESMEIDIEGFEHFQKLSDDK